MDELDLVEPDEFVDEVSDMADVAGLIEDFILVIS
jgi:signal recognition particle GTPase